MYPATSVGWIRSARQRRLVWPRSKPSRNDRNKTDERPHKRISFLPCVKIGEDVVANGGWWCRGGHVIIHAVLQHYHRLGHETIHALGNTFSTRTTSTYYLLSQLSFSKKILKKNVFIQKSETFEFISKRHQDFPLHLRFISLTRLVLIIIARKTSFT